MDVTKVELKYTACYSCGKAIGYAFCNPPQFCSHDCRWDHMDGRERISHTMREARKLTQLHKRRSKEKGSRLLKLEEYDG